MFNIKLLYRCYLCGELNSEEGNICLKCKKDCYIIDSRACSTCGTPLISEDSQCLRCRSTEYAFDKNISLFEYKNTAKDIFYLYKFRKHRKIARWYAFLLAGIIKKNFDDYIIVPSPYRMRKKIKKGWDQVECITDILCKKYNLPVLSVLKRSGNRDQKELGLSERQNNLKGKITVNTRVGMIKGQKIIFLDDIFTTGATASECAYILKKNGASVVITLTVAID